MKKFISIIVAVCAFFAAFNLTACEKADFTVGIVQLTTHDALDAATRGFKEKLEEEMKKSGKTVKFDYQNAGNDSAVCTTIANNFKSKGYDLILANATPALQATYAAVDNIPILGTSVTEYGVALNINDFNGTVGGNVSGTSDLADLDAQAQMIIDILPDAKKVALLYCSAEQNSKYQVDRVKAYLENEGITCQSYAFTDSNDLQSIVTAAADWGDAIYAPTDNTVANNTGIVDNVCRPKKVPVIAGEEGILKGCGIVSLTISYYGIGVETGRMAAEILLNGADISKMPISYDRSPVYKYNAAICEDLGITVPNNYVATEA